MSLLTSSADSDDAVAKACLRELTVIAFGPGYEWARYSMHLFQQ
jgi:hypothetical protein